jgi:hypothetical protein
MKIRSGGHPLAQLWRTPWGTIVAYSPTGSRQSACECCIGRVFLSSMYLPGKVG